MRYTNNRDWCRDCAWVFGPDRKGYITEMHSYGCNCICHHPTRLTAQIEELRVMQQQSAPVTAAIAPRAGRLERLSGAIKAALQAWRTA